MESSFELELPFSAIAGDSINNDEAMSDAVQAIAAARIFLGEIIDIEEKKKVKRFTQCKMYERHQ